MATIDSLANETLIDIMEMLKAPSLPLWDTGLQFPPGSYDDLRAAALVCSRWRDPAQRALFDTVILDSESNRNQVLLASSARSRYRTRSLEIIGPEVHGGMSWWLDVARATQGLEELKLKAPKALGDASPWNWDLLAHPCFAGLKHLIILFPEDFSDPAQSSSVLAMRLESLTLWIADSDHCAPSPELLAALFTASSPSLQTLHLKNYNLRSESSIIPSFHLVAAHLRTLILESTHVALNGHLDLLSPCASLEHLEIKRNNEKYLLNNRDDQSLSPLEIQAILDALPSTPTLRHLSLDFDEPLDLVPIAPILNHPSLRLLEKLNFPSMALRDGQGVFLEPRRELEDKVADALLSMKEACERRGISCKGMGECCMWK